MDIKDYHKRQFAIGFKALYNNQSELNQAGVAAAAGVVAPTISAIMRGNEEKFPGLKNQYKIAKVFGKDVHEVVSIGRAIERGEKLPLEADPKSKQAENMKDDTKNLSDEVPEPVKDLAELIRNNIVELSSLSQERLWDVAKYVHDLLLREKQMLANGISSERRIKQRRSRNDSDACPENDRRKNSDRRTSTTE